MFPIQVGSQVLLDASSPHAQQLLATASALRSRMYCLCKEAAPARLEPYKLGETYFVRCAKWSSMDHVFGCRHFGYSESSLAKWGLAKKTIVAKGGELVVALGSLLSARHGDSPRSPSQAEVEAADPPTSAKVATGQQGRGALALDDLARLLRITSRGGAWCANRPEFGFWERVRTSARTIKPRGMALGKWGLDDLLLLPLSADPAQSKRNFRKTFDAERAGHRVLAALQVDMEDVNLCAAVGQLKGDRALGLTSILSNRALKGALSTAPDAVDALRAGHVAVLLIAGTVSRNSSRLSVAFTSAAVLTCLKRPTPVGGVSQELRVSTTSA